MKKVLNDAGHGGRDPGASGNGYKEKDLTLKLALDVDKEIQRHSVKSYLTREDDRYVSLADRSNIANSLGVDVFISYHFNSFSKSSANGTETFSHPNSLKGKQLATSIQNEVKSIGLTDRGTKVANFSVLRRTKMPAALIEVCFISNKSDMDFFINNYEKYVQAMTKGIVKYLGVTYIPPVKNVPGIEKPVTPQITIVEDKINILLIADHVAVDGFIKDGTSYVNINESYIAIRDIFEAMGLEVGWDKDIRIITVDTRGDYKAPKGSKKVLLLGNRIDVQLHMHKGKNCLKIESAYIPIRDIFESLGFKVEWNRAESMIIIK